MSVSYQTGCDRDRAFVFVLNPWCPDTASEQTGTQEGLAGRWGSQETTSAQRFTVSILLSRLLTRILSLPTGAPKSLGPSLLLGGAEVCRAHQERVGPLSAGSHRFPNKGSLPPTLRESPVGAQVAASQYAW